ncbi:Transcriptional regulator, AraC family (plasmid) [Mycetohabitans rhizoxinica HKI 454]|uniref:Transcriptional regulator, AraC family n=2 Tax=Mycetohabitans rhizoxinica TaxID=412963 RepID=E5AUC4_MYCRK|nr:MULTISPECIES: helix-turn-helix transcriptional regulator [Mycetohabitans]MCG1048506.1 helix-turn-helix transcriptional regulator [Mycetohabitans sp. B6]CBW76697.1 Transcriptional regulator, AraC family [Mycetohabitans rhizoxinica HKI 454]
MLSADIPVLRTDIASHHAPTRGHPIRVRSRPMPASHGFAGHTHPWAQLTYSSRGVLRMTSMNTTWIVPPSRAVYVPPHMPHQVAVIEDAFLRTIYIDGSACPVGLSGCRVVKVSPLMREVIAALDARELPRRREALLCELLLDEMMRSRPLPLGVPLPTEKRPRGLCEAVLVDPAHAQTLEMVAARAGASVRTIARLFRQELGVSFSQWRQQAVLARAIPLLSQGYPLARVARQFGYQSQSAFSAMFRRAFGESPRAFFTRQDGAPGACESQVFEPDEVAGPIGSTWPPAP